MQLQTQQSSVFEHASYRTFLKSVLADRIARNGSYSLRAMAKQLGIVASHLSAIHNGAKNLSNEAALKISRKLELSSAETDYFCTLVQYENAKEPDLKNAFFERLQAMNPKREVKDLSVDAFKMIADWYHIPILEMTNITGINLTAKEIAKRLGITELESQVALERLERLELLERNAKGRYEKVHGNSVFKSDIPNMALRRFHKQMLERAIDSLETQTPQERYVGSQTFPIDLAQLDEARSLIDEFRKKLVELFIRGKKKTHVYHLGVQLFRVTKENGNERK